jgi:hypothetical protein
LDAASDE